MTKTEIKPKAKKSADERAAEMEAKANRIRAQGAERAAKAGDELAALCAKARPTLERVYGESEERDLASTAELRTMREVITTLELIVKRIAGTAAADETGAPWGVKKD